MTARRRKGKPYDPKTGHDRRSTDLLRNAMVAPMEVVDPYDANDKIVVMRSLRDDPLGRLHQRDQIDEDQYRAGRRFQADYEAAERGPKAIDFTKEVVDGGLLPEPITEAQRRAGIALKRVYWELGPDGTALVHDVLIHGRTMQQVAESRRVMGERWTRYFAMRLQECLDRLMIVYGFSNERRR